jgi:VanZ family protein
LADTMNLNQCLQQALGWRRAWRWLLALLVLVICWLAFSPAPPPQLHTHWDKLNHALAFASLAWCATLGWPTPPGAHAGWHRLRLALALLAFGAFVEVVQAQMPPRSAEWADLLADGVGIVLGWALVQGLHLACRSAAAR